jgi:acetyltransferase-like isoleucine patch superfamily enzyme
MDRIRTHANNHPLLKKLLWKMVFSGNEGRPRTWLRMFINPLIIQRGRSTKIRRSVRLDIVPFHIVRIGRGSLLEDYATLNNRMGPVEIGDHSLVGIGNILIGPVTVGAHVLLAPHVVLSGLNHAYTDVSLLITDQDLIPNEIVLEDNVWIGANSVVTSGVRIGTHVVIAAGSVVTKDIPAYSVAAGNPAQLVKTYNRQTQRWERVEGGETPLAPVTREVLE